MQELEERLSKISKEVSDRIRKEINKYEGKEISNQLKKELIEKIDSVLLIENQVESFAVDNFDVFLDSINKANTELVEKQILVPEKVVKPEIAFDDYMKLDIRICEILSVEKVEKKDKLYKLEINTGFDKRIVVSAIALVFTPEQLLNKKFPFILNLAPRNIAGIKSEAMIILSESSDKKLFSIGDENAEIGAQVI